jgi:hypothetical protein
MEISERQGTGELSGLSLKKAVINVEYVGCIAQRE